MGGFLIRHFVFCHQCQGLEHTFSVCYSPTLLRNKGIERVSRGSRNHYFGFFAEVDVWREKF